MNRNMISWMEINKAIEKYDIVMELLFYLWA